MLRVNLIVLVVCLLGHLASAQTYFQPVQYQFGAQTKFYYGGRDARLFEQATRDNRFVSDEPERVYSDDTGFQNARYFGHTATDAYNDAYANTPTYFRKSELLNATLMSRPVVPAVIESGRAEQAIAAPATTSASVKVYRFPVRPPPVLSDHVRLVVNR